MRPRTGCICAFGREEITVSKTFTPVSLDGRQQYYELWERTPQRSLDYTLANLWGWQDYYGLEWCFEDNLCWIRQTRPKHLKKWPQRQQS